MIVVTDSIDIKGDLGSVFQCFWQPECWVGLTPHVKHIEMLERGDLSQRFRMCVESDGKEYVTETVRSAVLNKRIFYEQLRPPALFQQHTGEWDFSAVAGSVRVALTHCVVLNESAAKDALGVASGDQAEEKVCALLRRNGRLTMSAIKRLIEDASRAETSGVREVSDVSPS